MKATPEENPEHPPEPNSQSFQWGFRIREPAPEVLLEVIEAAFDYRGDISLKLRSGEEITGYIFNRDRRDGQSYLEMFPKDSDSRIRITYSEIIEIHFSGRDTASGRSWETWVKSYWAKRQARERGEEVGPIGIESDALQD